MSILYILNVAPLLVLQQVPAKTVDWDNEFGVEDHVRDPQHNKFPVDPYVHLNENAGAHPFSSDSMAKAFGGIEGIRRIANRLVNLSEADSRTSDIFVAHDAIRLRRTLFEQFCYILRAGCDYTGRNMADMNALVENLQQAMREDGVPFAAQNRFLAKLAPQSKDAITR